MHPPRESDMYPPAAGDAARGLCGTLPPLSAGPRSGDDRLSQPLRRPVRLLRQVSSPSPLFDLLRFDLLRPTVCERWRRLGGHEVVCARTHGGCVDHPGVCVRVCAMVVLHQPGSSPACRERPAPAVNASARELARAHTRARMHARTDMCGQKAHACMAGRLCCEDPPCVLGSSPAGSFPACVPGSPLLCALVASTADAGLLSSARKSARVCMPARALVCVRARKLRCADIASEVPLPRARVR